MKIIDYDKLKFTSLKYGVDIIPYNISEFISAINTYDKVSQMLLNHTN